MGNLHCFVLIEARHRCPHPSLQTFYFICTLYCTDIIQLFNYSPVYFLGVQQLCFQVSKLKGDIYCNEIDLTFHTLPIFYYITICYKLIYIFHLKKKVIPPQSQMQCCAQSNSCFHTLYNQTALKSVPYLVSMCRFIS